MDRNLKLSLLTVASSIALASCGGGDSSTAVVPPTGLTPAQAATDTASTNALCSEQTLGPYYWEIGNQTQILASGTVGSGVDASTLMNIASASKWIYASYVVETKSGVLNSTTDVPFLNFTSGYANFQVPICIPNEGTVDQCLAQPAGNGTTYGTQLADVTGVFDYNSGHMEVHASNSGMGSFDNGALADTIVPVVFGTLGSGQEFTYTDPQLAGGGYTNAETYRIFLRRLLTDSPAPLTIAGMLEDNVVPTAGTNTNGQTAVSPITEPWHYGLGHWIEDNSSTTNTALNTVNDGAYNSGGALGFYPWVSHDRTLYGILARQQSSPAGNEGYDSAQCGRLIRQAYLTSQTQTANPLTP